MQIKQSEYLITAVKPSQYPEELAAITLLGRSNVGKSSLINCLCNKKGMARTSSAPGKTRTINFYLIEKDWYFVDLPGYGYAKVSKSERDNWKVMIDSFMDKYQGLKYFWLLVDIRHEPSELDKQMWQWLINQEYPSLVIATKADKISRGARDKHINMIAKALKVHKQFIIPFSAEDKLNKELLLKNAESFLELRKVKNIGE